MSDINYVNETLILLEQNIITPDEEKDYMELYEKLWKSIKFFNLSFYENHIIYFFTFIYIKFRNEFTNGLIELTIYYCGDFGLNFKSVVGAQYFSEEKYEWYESLCAEIDDELKEDKISFLIDIINDYVNYDIYTVDNDCKNINQIYDPSVVESKKCKPVSCKFVKEELCGEDCKIGSGVDGIVFNINESNVAKFLNLSKLTEKISLCVSPNFFDKNAAELFFTFFVEKFNSINFIGDNYASMCYANINGKNHPEVLILMEKLDFDLKSFFSSKLIKINTKLLFQIYFQIIHALIFLQEHKINHCDLHIGNILCKYYTEPVKVKYRTPTSVITFYTNIIIKLADWGRARKFSEPSVVPIKSDNWNYPSIFEKGYDMKKVCSYFSKLDPEIKQYTDMGLSGTYSAKNILDILENAGVLEKFGFIIDYTQNEEYSSSMRV